MNVLKMLWRGELPLGETFWQFGFAASIFISMCFWLTFLFGMDGMLKYIVVVMILLFSFAHCIFMSVSIWRSAGKSMRVGIVPILARVIVVFWVLQKFITFNLFILSLTSV